MNKEQALMILVSAASQARLTAADHNAIQQAQQFLIGELGISVESSEEPEENGE
jgi:hypothetical protein